MAAKAEALVIIIDVNPSAGVKVENGQTFLEKSVTAANMIIQRKIFNATGKTKNEACLILFGTEGTLNPLYEDGGEGYRHITIAKELDVMDLELLNFINKNITVGSQHADFLDALVVAVDHLHDKCMGRKMDQKVILFTNLNSPFADDKLEIITNSFKNNDVNFVFVGPEFEEEEESGPSQPLSQQQNMGSRCMHHILEQVDGEGVSADDVLPMLSFFETRRKKQVTTFRGPIEIGSKVKINTWVYVKTKEERPSSWKKSSALSEYAGSGGTLGVEMQRSYHLNNDEQTEVEKENIAQAFRYGKTLVPMTADDKKTLKLDTVKSCVVLGFTSKKNISFNMHSRDGAYTFTPQPEDAHAAVAFSALCHALEEKEMVAIVRFVFRGNADPKLGFLTPHLKSSYESLIFVALPFREDLRQYYFPPLPPSSSASAAQKAAVNGLIDNMMLVERDDEDGDGGEKELLKPSSMLNPVTQRQCQCIQDRALDPEQVSIPEVEDYILNSIRPLPEMAKNCKRSLDEIKERFPMKEVENKAKTGSNVFKADDGEPDEKKVKGEDNENNDGAFTLHGLSKSHVTEIGTVDPVADFLTLIEGCTADKFSEVGKQMKECTIRLVQDSFIDQYYSKAVRCIKSMREQSEKRKTGVMFNSLLTDLKTETRGKRKDDFWKRMVAENILPLDKDVAGDSTFTGDEAASFYSSGEQKAENKEFEIPIDDDDDLLDML